MKPGCACYHADGQTTNYVTWSLIELFNNSTYIQWFIAACAFVLLVPLMDFREVMPIGIFVTTYLAVAYSGNVYIATGTTSELIFHSPQNE
jgi:hypothetical protein